MSVRHPIRMGMAVLGMLLLGVLAWPVQTANASSTLVQRARDIGAAAVANSTRSRWGAKTAAQVLAGDPDSAKGLAKLMIAAKGVAGSTSDESKYVKGLFDALQVLKREIGDQKLKDFLTDFDELHKWAKQNDQLDRLEGMVKSFATSDRGAVIGDVPCISFSKSWKSCANRTLRCRGEKTLS